MGHLSYEDSKKAVMRGLILLAVVTLVEVGFSLAGKGHIGFLKFFSEIKFLGYFVALVLIGLSLYKAVFIIYEFMHLKFEVKGLARSILIPTALLIWAIIAFFMEGNYWKDSRAVVDQFNNASSETSIQPLENQAAETKTIEVHSEDHSDEQH